MPQPRWLLDNLRHWVADLNAARLGAAILSLHLHPQLSAVRMRVTSLEGELNQAKALQESVEKDFNRLSGELAAVSDASTQQQQQEQQRCWRGGRSAAGRGVWLLYRSCVGFHQRVLDSSHCV